MINTIELKLSEPQLAIVQHQIDAALEQIILNTERRTIKHQYLNKIQACHYVNVSFNTLQDWIKCGLPCYKINNVTRFSTQEIDEWIHSHPQNNVGKKDGFAQ